MANLMLVNPAKRRKTKKAKRRVSVARKSITRSATKLVRRKYRRNPITGGSGLQTQITNAAIGAAGALAVDIAMTKLPIPAAMQTGIMRSAAQGLVSLGLGMLVAKVAKNRRLGTQLAEGGLTIALHGVMKGAAAKTMPNLALGDGLLGDGLLGDGLLGDDLLGYDNSMGYTDSMGYLNPAQTFEAYDSDENY